MTISRKEKKKLLIEQMLYTITTAATGKAYTKVPKGSIEPMRLLRGLPAFRARGAAKPDKKPKMLFIRYHFYEDHFNESDYYVASLLQYMVNAGFKIYYQLDDSVALLDEKYFKCSKPPRYEFDPNEILSAINRRSDTKVTKQELLILDNLFTINGIHLSELVDYHRMSVVHADPLNVRLLNDTINQSTFDKILNNYKDKIETLEISQCMQLEYIGNVGKQYPTLSKLKKFIFHVSQYKMPYLGFTNPKSVYTSPPNLLHGTDAPNKDLEIEIMMDNINITSTFYQVAHITKLTLTRCGIRGSRILTQFFEQANNLIELRMDDTPYPGKEYTRWPTSPSVPKLKKLELSYCHLDIDELYHLLTGGQLESLTLISCTISSPSNRYNKSIDFKHLTKLTLMETALNHDIISTWLSSAPNLEELTIANSTRKYHTGHLGNIHLPKLKKLQLEHFNFSGNFLSELLQETNQLEELSLMELALDECKPLKINFNTLKKLELRECEDDKAYIPPLILANPSLESLIIKESTFVGDASIDCIVQSLKQLKVLHIETHDLTIQQLELLLSLTTQLEDLTINKLDYNTIANSRFADTRLPHLQSLKLSSLSFDVTSYENLTGAAPKLQELYLNDCMIDQDSTNCSVRSLKVLSMSNSRYAARFTNKVLGGVDDLEQLYIDKCGGYEQCPYLLSIKHQLLSITITNTDMRKTHVSELLQHTMRIKRIILRSSTFASISFYTRMLQHVEEMDLSNCRQTEPKQSYSGGSILEDTPFLRNFTDSGSNRRTYQTDGISSHHGSPARATLTSSHTSTTTPTISAKRAEPEVEEVEEVDDHDSNRPQSPTAENPELPDILNKPPQSPPAPPKPIKRDPATLPAQKSEVIDATANKCDKQSRTVKTTFFGRPHNPDPRLMRGTCFNSFGLNPACSGRHDVFLLNETISEEQFFTEQLLTPPRSKTKLYARFEREERAIYGRFNLTLSPQWQKLPSYSASESIIAYYMDKNLPVEFIKSKQNHLHYIRLSDHANPTDSYVYIELLLSSPTPKLTFSDLPPGVREIAKFCRGFRDEPLKADDCGTATKFYAALIKQRRGTCRHRANVFALMMNEAFPDIPVRIMSDSFNGVDGTHMYAEVIYQGEVITVDCGGSPCEISYTQEMLPEQHNTSNERDPWLNPENTFSLHFSPHGHPAPPSYFEKTTNLTSVEFEKELRYVDEIVLNSIDTLKIKSCDLTANELHALLQKTTSLRTLSLIHCTIAEEEFRALDFSMLKALTFVKLVGSCVTNVDDVTKLINTTSNQTEWVIDTDHLQTSYIASRVTLKNSFGQKSLPQSRYFKPTREKTLADITKKSNTSTLIDSVDNHAIATALQYQCQTEGRAWFSIGSGDDFISSAPGITKQPDMTGQICQGPTGPFYQFIKSHTSGIIIVDYLNFKHADYVRFNSLYNQVGRHVDGLEIPHTYKVIGTTDLSAPHAYRGADFVSRFDKQVQLGAFPVPANAIVNLKSPAPCHATRINLAGGNDWEARLVGHWTIHGTKLIFTEGLFVKYLRAGHTDFNFNNCPSTGEDKEFDTFLRNLDIHQGVFIHGELIHQFTKPCSIYFSNDIDMSVIDNHIDFMNHTESAKYTNILNGATLCDFLGKYHKDPLSNGILLATGSIEKHKNASLFAYLTCNLNHADWLALLDCLKEHQTKLLLTLAPGVSLPSFFNMKAPKKTLELAPRQHTTVSFVPTGEAAHYPQGAIVIDVTELTEADLLDSLNGVFNQANLSFEFSTVRGFLTQALDAGKTIYLKGTFSNDLAEALHPLLQSRLTLDICKGQLAIITDNAHLFNLVANTTIQPAVKGTISKKSVIFDNRLQDVAAALVDNPFLTIVGSSGTGKTYFMLETWKAKYGCFYGEEQFAAWINAKPVADNSYNVFLIDECDTVGRDYMEFGGLQHEPPGIFKNGQFHQLAESREKLRHRVVFIHNPHSYGGERRQPRLFLSTHTELEFQPFPLLNLLQGDSIPHTVRENITKVINYVEEVYPGKSLLTPREILMMIEMSKVTCAKYADLDENLVAKHFAYFFAAQHIKNAYDRQTFKWSVMYGNEFNLELPPLPNTILNDYNKIAYQALIHQLDLRAARINQTVAVYSGLGGLIIEGEPGLGKSLLVEDVLQARGLKKNIDYVCIPVSLDFDKKVSSLLHAFHEGMIVAIDEINSSPMLEFLLNALLSGYDLQFNRARKPGFMLFGTQNPAGSGERLELTLPLLHRLQVIQLQPYGRQTLIHILRKKGLPHKIALSMVYEYLDKKEKNDSKWCSRDLFKRADKWLHKGVLDTIRLQPLFAIPQVGQMCKIVSIANIDAYFAEKYHYTPTPLRKNHQFFTSHRQIAKENGSRQGEILEFARWQAHVTQLGYESEVVDFTGNNNLFLATIVDSLKNGDLPMIAFAVDKETGHPDPSPLNPEDREHAAVIVGYNPHKDEVTLMHWGHQYAVNFSDLFHSCHALSKTRQQEFYLLNSLYNAGNKAHVHKYLPSKSVTGIASIVPKEGTGFGGKMIIVKKPGVGFKKKSL